MQQQYETNIIDIIKVYKQNNYLSKQLLEIKDSIKSLEKQKRPVYHSISDVNGSNKNKHMYPNNDSIYNKNNPMYHNNDSIYNEPNYIPNKSNHIHTEQSEHNSKLFQSKNSPNLIEEDFNSNKIEQNFPNKDSINKDLNSTSRNINWKENNKSRCLLSSDCKCYHPVSCYNIIPIYKLQNYNTPIYYSINSDNKYTLYTIME